MEKMEKIIKPLEIKWIGHAGAIIRKGGLYVAIDPFLLGKFYWNGKEEVYHGNSPWIGLNNKTNFIEKYGPKLSAICLTHAHGDHFDFDAIVGLLQKNPDIQIIAPYPITNWLKHYSGLEGIITQFLTTIKVNEPIIIEEDEECVEILSIPNPKSEGEEYPSRGGYFIGEPKQVGIAHVGDSHEIGQWEHVKNRVNTLILWGCKKHKRITKYFSEGGELRRIIWIHWEEFRPGNFSCSQDPNQFTAKYDNSKIEKIVPNYREWISIS